MRVFLVNPSHVSFGTAVITPRLLYVLAGATPAQGADPIVLGESVNTLTTYGFDPVTGMQEPKATLCQVRAA